MSDAIEAARVAFIKEVRSQDSQWTDESDEGENLLVSPSGDFFAVDLPLLAALTAYEAAKGGGVGVVPLEWRELTSPREDGPPEPVGEWEADSAVGIYIINDEGGEWWLGLATVHDTVQIGRSSDPDILRSKAQADYESRIRSALTSPASGERDAVIEECARVEHHKLDTDAQVFFYEQDFYVLSNFSSFNLRWHGRTFPTSEHAYHWSRFALGWDLTDAAGMDAAPVAVRIMSAPSAHEAFKLAQEYRDLQHPNWGRDKIDTMRRILFAKAKQHEYVSRKLLATGDRELVEDSWRDDFWGWGPNRDGQNMLGKLWMEVRAALRMEGK